jgi:hypothetical protein
MFHVDSLPNSLKNQRTAIDVANSLVSNQSENIDHDQFGPMDEKKPSHRLQFRHIPIHRLDGQECSWPSSIGKKTNDLQG